MIEVYEVDIKNSYYIDDDLNIWEDTADFFEYHIEEYEGIKDNIELWQEELCEEHNLQELMGDEVIEKVVKDLESTIEYWRNKYYKELEENYE